MMLLLVMTMMMTTTTTMMMQTTFLTVIFGFICVGHLILEGFGVIFMPNQGLQCTEKITVFT